MDSQKIAAVLEARYPTPSLHLDDPALAKIEAVFPKLMPSLAPNIMPLVPVNLLNPPSAEYFQRTRAMRFGMPLDEFHALKGGEQAWEATGPVIAEIAAILKEDGSGPFIMGKTPSYADFYVASMLTFLERVDPKLLERWMAFDPVFGELYTACQPWLQRDQ